MKDYKLYSTFDRRLKERLPGLLVQVQSGVDGRVSVTLNNAEAFALRILPYGKAEDFVALEERCIAAAKALGWIK